MIPNRQSDHSWPSMKYLFVIEHATTNLSGYFPDVPGCVTTGASVVEILANASEALEFHLEDEHEFPPSRSLEEHLAGGLETNDRDLIAWIQLSAEPAIAA